MPSAWATKPRANDGDKKVEIQSEAPWRKGLEEHESGEDPMRREEEFWKDKFVTRFLTDPAKCDTGY